MFNLTALFKIRSGKKRSAKKQPELWDFHGGIHPPEMKSPSNSTPLQAPPLPAQLILPLKQHLGDEGELCVSAGDQVLRGQPLTRGNRSLLPIHAPTSGLILAIEPHITTHPSGLPARCVVIQPDGNDNWINRQPWPDYLQHSRDALIERIHQFGIAGLGGAGFPTAAKLQHGGDHIHTLIINGAECEPYITADDRLMREHAMEILQGIGILIYILQPQQVLIGIEDNKPEAIACLQQAIPQQATQTHSQIDLRIIPTKYPSGGAHQLTEILTGRQVPYGGRSSDIGVLMQNIGTTYAIKRAVINGEPLTERVITLTGNALQRPGNVWARLGTPVSHLLDFAGFTPQPEQSVIMGGPLMGFTLADLQAPVVKISNCLLAPAADEIPQQQPEKACIRCSACAESCPVKLLPQQLFWFCQGQEHNKAQAYHLQACIECGICAWVCPSHIPLVQYFRQEKAELRDIEQQARRASEAKARFQARQARLEREKLARNQRHQQSATQQPTTPPTVAVSQHTQTPQAPAEQTRQAALAAALARVKARKAQQQTPPPELQHQLPKEQMAETDTTCDTVTIDPRKAAVAAALARVQARKAQQQAQQKQLINED